ncbi:hypothetical protein VDGL01_07116 [Verticillium dahliae]
MRLDREQGLPSAQTPEDRKPRDDMTPKGPRVNDDARTSDGSHNKKQAHSQQKRSAEAETIDSMVSSVFEMALAWRGESLASDHGSIDGAYLRWYVSYRPRCRAINWSGPVRLDDLC